MLYICNQMSLLLTRQPPCVKWVTADTPSFEKIQVPYLVCSQQFKFQIAKPGTKPRENRHKSLNLIHNSHFMSSPSYKTLAYFGDLLKYSQSKVKAKQLSLCCFFRCGITESQNSLGWREPLKVISSMPLQWAATSAHGVAQSPVQFYDSVILESDMRINYMVGISTESSGSESHQQTHQCFVQSCTEFLFISNFDTDFQIISS